MVSYNCIYAYKDSVAYVEKYRRNELTKDEKREIKNEWDAMKYGAKDGDGVRFINSIVWPYALTNDIIPYIVLKLGKP
jgi:hypothetical protein